jgi:hypothetical protein
MVAIHEEAQPYRPNTLRTATPVHRVAASLGSCVVSFPRAHISLLFTPFQTTIFPSSHMLRKNRWHCQWKISHSAMKMVSLVEKSEDIIIPRVLHLCYSDTSRVPGNVWSNLRDACEGYDIRIYDDEMCATIRYSPPTTGGICSSIVSFITRVAYTLISKRFQGFRSPRYSIISHTIVSTLVWGHDHTSIKGFWPHTEGTRLLQLLSKISLRPLKALQVCSQQRTWLHLRFSLIIFTLI